MAWITPKTDWNNFDYFNFEDLNRIENNTKEVASIISKLYYLPTQTYVLNRTMKTIEFASGFNRIEGNINQLSTFNRPSNWLPMKLNWRENDSFTYEDANRLERNLLTLYQYYTKNYSILASEQSEKEVKNNALHKDALEE